MAVHAGRSRESVSGALASAVGVLGRGHASRLEAEAMLSHVLGVSRAALLASSREPLSPGAARAFDGLVARRLDGEPLAYLVGSAPFLDFTLEVTRGVIVPRPETELLASWAIERALLRPPPVRVLDAGTGCGPLAIAIARAVPEADVEATDCSGRAVALAIRNVSLQGLSRRVRVSRADLVPPGRGRFDVVVANLPYVADGDPDLAPEVRRHEPAEALFGGADGLDVIRRFLGLVPGRLAAGGDVGLEIGWRQGARAHAMAAAALAGGRVRLHPDMAGLDRLVTVEGVPCRG